MKIAINHTLFQSYGGAERYVYALVQRLLGDGHEVHYFCSRRRDDFEHPALHFHDVKRARGVRFWKVLSFARNSERVMREAGPFDVTHGFSKTWYHDVYTDGSGLHSFYRDYTYRDRGKLAKALLQYQPYHLAVEAMDRKRFTRGNFVKILTMSRFVKEQIQQGYGLTDEEVEVLYNGIDTDEFHPGLREEHRGRVLGELGIPDSACVVLFVGSDYRRKNLEVLLRAAAELNNGQEFHYLVCGRDNHESKYQALAAKCGLDARVHFLGLQPEIKPFFGASDVFVLPTFYDVFGMVVFEAMACSVPCIVSKLAGASEIIVDGQNGVVQQDPEDVTELRGALQKLGSRERRLEMGRAARATTLDYAWEPHMKRLYEIYEEVARKKRASQGPSKSP